MFWKIQKALAQLFSCGFCEIFKNIFFTEELWAEAAAGGVLQEKVFF